MTRLRRAIAAYFRDVARMAQEVGGIGTLMRYALDRLALVIMRKGGARPYPVARQLRFKNGVTIRYRVNRGDLQSIREVWLTEAYRLPTEGNRQNLVDLGANIGCASIWLACHYGCRKVIAVEAAKSNASFVRENFLANGIQGTVVEAAVGPVDGVTRFAEDAASNLGHVSAEGYEVPMVSMSSLLRRFLPGERIDLLKIDIEGGEQALLEGPDLSWLSQIKEIIIEFHPTLVDYPRLVGILKNRGFEYLAAHGPPSPRGDYFFRRPLGP